MTKCPAQDVVNNHVHWCDLEYDHDGAASTEPGVTAVHVCACGLRWTTTNVAATEGTLQWRSDV